MKPKPNSPKPAEPEPEPTLDDEDEDLEGLPPEDFQYPSNPELGLFRTIAEVAIAMSVSQRTVSRWLEQGAPGKWPCGRYDQVGFRRWLRGLDTSHYPRQRKGDR